MEWLIKPLIKVGAWLSYRIRYSPAFGLICQVILAVGQRGK
jgi:hypothetical protein